MPPVTGTGTGTKMTITTEYLAMRLDRLIELLQDCLGVTGDGGDLQAKGDDVGDLQSSDDDSTRPTADGTGDSSAARIAEGRSLADEGGGSTEPSNGGSEGIGGLLTVKGGGCDLDAGAGVILGTNSGSSIIMRVISSIPSTIVDIYEPPGHRPEHAGQARCSGRRCPRRGR
jgi:hypothetical protein